MALSPPDGRVMPVGAPFNGAMAKARELVAKLRFAAGQAADEEAALVRARELDAEEYAARHATRRVTPDHEPTPSEDAS
jgi:hypothetical protein